MIPTLNAEDIDVAVNVHLGETLISESDCEEIAEILNKRLVDKAADFTSK